MADLSMTDPNTLAGSTRTSSSALGTESTPDNKRTREEESDPEIPERLIDFTNLKRKRIPSDTLIGGSKVRVGDSNTAIISGFAVPTRTPGGFAHFPVRGNSVERDGNITREIFYKTYPNVSITTTTITLPNSKMLSPGRIRNTILLQDKAPDDSTPLPTDEPTEQDKAPDTSSSTSTDEPTEQNKVPVDLPPLPSDGPIGKMDKEIEKDAEEVLSAMDTQIEEEIASDPVSKPPVDAGPDSYLGILRVRSARYMAKYLDLLNEAPGSEEEREFGKLLLEVEESIKMETERLKNENVPTSVPEVQEVEDQDTINIQTDNEETEQRLSERQNQTTNAKQSPEGRLSGNQIGGPSVESTSSGDHTTVDPENVMDEDVVDNTTMAVEPAKDHDTATAMDIDHNNSDRNTGSSVLLGADQAVSPLDEGQHEHFGTGASANLMEASNMTEKMDTSDPTPEPPRQAASKMETEKDVDAIEEAKRMAEFKHLISEGAVGMQRKTEISRGGRHSEDLLKSEAEKERDKVLTLTQTGGDIPGFDTAMANLKEQGVIKDVMDIKQRKMVLAQFRKDNKMIDVLTASAPTEQDVFAESVREQTKQLGIKGLMGTSGVGTPIFVPGASRTELYELQRGVATLTNEEAIQLRAELTPLWTDFKRARLHSGVVEMERMPTRLLKSDRSSVREASKIRDDIKEEELAFGRFMFWLIHDRLDSTRFSTWRKFLLYSASLGHNNLTQAQINWIVTGNENGDLSANTRFFTLSDEEGDPLDKELPIRGGGVLRYETVNRLAAQVLGNPSPSTPYPSKNTSPSAAPVDNSIHPDGSSGPDRANRSELRGIPTHIMNIPDPRVSKRGGEEVPNVRIATIRNPKHTPDKNEGDEGYEPPYITREVPDIGAGSKDIGAHIDASLSDRLIRSLPTKLYAPIHAQACDRYLGSLNYQRLSLPIERYMKAYSQHPWGPTDFQQMYDWNVYTMQLYGEMLYAFVTDINMQRTSPVFTLDTPEAVGDEYMELNELMHELARFQQHADDRAERIGDSGAGKRPLEEELDKFFKNQDNQDRNKLLDGNVAIVSLPDTPFPESDDRLDTEPPPPPPPNMGQPQPIPSTPPPSSSSSELVPTRPGTILVNSMDSGIRRMNDPSSDQSTSDKNLTIQRRLFDSMHGRR